MTHLLPPNLLRLFAPRPPIPHLKPTAIDAYNALPLRQHEGVAGILEELREQAALKDAEEEEQKEEKAKLGKKAAAAVTTAKKEPDGDAEMPTAQTEAKKENGEEGETGEIIEDQGESKVQLDGQKDDTSGLTHTEAEKLRLRIIERKRKREEDVKLAIKDYQPTENPEAVGDPYKTLFISRLHYNATEEDLRREFSMYGPIERIHVVRVKPKEGVSLKKQIKNKGKSRGYAFILYEREKDMKAAYKDAEGIKILGRRILVDVERGRTVKGWKPRRLGGGLGGRPKPVAPDAIAPSFSDRRPGGGGFAGRGGFSRGGGFGGGRGGSSRGGFGGPPGGGGGGGSRGGGVGFRGGFGGGGGDRGSDRGGGGGGGFNQRDMIGQTGGGWGARASGGGPPSGGGGYSSGPPQSGSYPPRGMPAGGSGASYGGNFEVPRGGGSSSGGGGYGDSSSRGGYSDSRGSDRGGYDRGGGYGDRDSKRPRY